MKVYVDKVKLQEYTTKLTAKFKTIFALKGETATDEQVAEAVTDWLDTNVNPVGSAVVVDSSLSISGAAADAKATGDDLADLKNAMNGSNNLHDIAKDYIINSSGNWTQPAAKHVRLSVKSGDVVNITGGSIATTYGFLKSHAAAAQNDSADFSTETGYTSRIVLNANANTGDIIVPSDAVLLYIAVLNNTSQNQSPSSVLINGVEMIYNIRKKIDSLSVFVSENAQNIEGLAESTTNIKQELTDFSSKQNLDIWGVRKAYNRQFSKLDFSSFSFMNGFDLPIYFDGFGIKHYVDLSLYKNVSGNVYEVSNNTELSNAISSAASGDTIIVNEGIYTPITLTKSVNLIGKGNPIFVTVDAGSFSPTSSIGAYKSDSTFPVSPTLITEIYDATYIEDGIIVPLTKVYSANIVGTTPGTWSITSAGQVYVHLYNGNEASNRNVIMTYDTGYPISCTQPEENATIYLEGITCIGGRSNLLYCDITGYNTQKLIAKDCRFYYGKAANNISLFGVCGYFQNCDSSYSYKDGFNYHANTTSEYSSGTNTGTISYAFEIDCIAHDNGKNDVAETPSDNGSTIHNNGTAIRINGVYFNNNGGNVADTGGATESYNYNCYAFDSIAPQDTNRADFWANNGADMYLYGCRSSGNSQYNLWGGTSAKIYVSNTEYSTTIGSVIPV